MPVVFAVEEEQPLAPGRMAGDADDLGVDACLLRGGFGDVHQRAVREHGQLGAGTMDARTAQRHRVVPGGHLAQRVRPPRHDRPRTAHLGLELEEDAAEHVLRRGTERDQLVLLGVQPGLADVIAGDDALQNAHGRTPSDTGPCG